MSKYPKNYHDVNYYVPGRKNPVAGSTVATSGFLGIICEEHPGWTVEQIRDLIADRRQFILDPEAVAVCDAYIKAGYGNLVPAWRY